MILQNAGKGKQRKTQRKQPNESLRVRIGSNPTPNKKNSHGNQANQRRQQSRDSRKTTQAVREEENEEDATEKEQEHFTQQCPQGNKRIRKEQEDKYGQNTFDDTQEPDEIEQLMEAWLTKYTPTEEQEQDAHEPETKTEKDQKEQEQKTKERKKSKSAQEEQKQKRRRQKSRSERIHKTQEMDEETQGGESRNKSICKSCTG